MFSRIKNIQIVSAISPSAPNAPKAQQFTSPGQSLRRPGFDDIVIRWGGEEFLLIFSLANKEYLGHIVTNVLHSVNKFPVPINDKDSVPITISAGAVCFPVITNAPHIFSFDKAIMLCDKALYESKSNGRNQARYVVPTTKALEDAHKAGGVSIDNFFESRDYSTIHVLH